MYTFGRLEMDLCGFPLELPSQLPLYNGEVVALEGRNTAASKGSGDLAKGLSTLTYRYDIWITDGTIWKQEWKKDLIHKCFYLELSLLPV